MTGQRQHYILTEQEKKMFTQKYRDKKFTLTTVPNDSTVNTAESSIEVQVELIP